jgi:hypothetical protein
MATWPFLCTDRKVVAARRRLDRVQRDLQVAVGAVLEADRRRQARGQFAVHLALGGARADGAPGDQVADVLRRDHVQELAAGRQAQPVDLDQQLARDAQAFVDAVALVEVGIVDQALPAHRGARLLEIDAHHDLQRVGVAVAQGLQAPGVVQRGGRVVDRAWAHHHQQAVVLAGHDVVDGLAGVGDQRLHGRAMDGEEADEVFRWGQHGDVLDASVVGLAGSIGGTLGPGITGRVGFGGHHGLLGKLIRVFRGNKKNRRAVKLRRFSVRGWGAYALASRPPGTENQK